MTAATVIPPGGGEVVGDTPDRRVEIVAEQDALHATRARLGPRREGADLHVHRRHSDLFYVLEGELTVRLGPEDEGMVVAAGTLARVPPLVVHGFRNAGDAPVGYLNFHAPGQGFASYLRALRDGRTLEYDQEPPPADGGRPAAEAVVGGAGPSAGRPGLRMTLLADVAEVGIAEASADAGNPPPAPHVHRRHAESLYVLEGELTLTAGERVLRAASGSWLQVPPGVPHAVSVAAPSRFLALHAPGCGFGAFVRGLAGDGDEQAVAERAAFDQAPAP